MFFELDSVGESWLSTIGEFCLLVSAKIKRFFLLSRRLEVGGTVMFKGFSSCCLTASWKVSRSAVYAFDDSSLLFMKRNGMSTSSMPWQ